MKNSAITYGLKYFGLLLVLVSTACSSSAGSTLTETSPQAASTVTAEPIPASSTVTNIPPTDLPTATKPHPTNAATRTLRPTGTPRIASSPEDILGLWRGTENRDGMYHQFNADGSCQISTVRDVIDTNPNVVCKYWFEGTNLYMEEVELRGLPACGFPGIYEVHLLPDGWIDFTTVDDNCAPRARTTAQLHEPVR